MHGGHRWLALLILRLLSTAGLAGGSQEIPLFDSRGPSFVSTAAADDGVHEEGNGVSQDCDIDESVRNGTKRDQFEQECTYG